MQAKTLPRIFVDVRDVQIIVQGHTGPRAKALGFEGLGFKWNQSRQQWKVKLNLRNLEALDRWPEVELSAEATEAMEAFRRAVAKREAYYAARAKA
jgi:hypothetical protein